MADFRINILGCGSATPSLRHLPACQVIDFRNRLMMIDCGEGAQLSMRRMKLKFSRLSHIFISHLHGDHCLGLPGLLSTLSLNNEGGTVVVHTFKEGAELFQRMIDFFCPERSFNLQFNIIKVDKAVIYEDHAMTVETFPLYHRVPCVGFIFREKPKQRHIIRDLIDFYQVPVSQIPLIKKGADFTLADGTVIPNERLTRDADPSLSYAYCSDTVYDPRVAEAVKGVDVIYHEATYINSEIDKAHSRGHSTAAEAAKIACAAGARQLILGHFSKAYRDETGHLAEAQNVVSSSGLTAPEVIIANEGLTIDLL